MSKAIIFLTILSLLCVLSTQYDAAVATKMAKASFATYCAADRLEDMKCGANCNSLKGYTFTKQVRSAISWAESLTFSTFVNNDEKRVIIAFRGTNTPAQLVSELGLSAGVNFGLCGNVQNAKALKYFYDGYNNQLRNSLLAQVRELVKSFAGYSFYITGHSLGGALGTIAALDLSCNGIVSKDQLHLYTFGSPRVGDVNLAKAVMNAVSEHWRVVHDKDIVPHVPPCKKNAFGQCTSDNLGSDGFLGAVNYAWHLGNEVFYNQDFSSFKICSNAEDSSCSNQVVFTSVFDHLNYLGTVQSCY